MSRPEQHSRTPAQPPRSGGHPLFWYAAALLVWSGGLLLAAWRFPGGFDWQYTVASALASRQHNPAGSLFFSGALVLAMVLLWFYVSRLKHCPNRRELLSPFALGAIRVGLFGFALVGAERLLVRDLSDLFYKAHELLALVAFFAMFLGVVGTLAQMALRRRRYLLPLLLVVIPLLAIGVVQLTLYLQQRDLGWVDTGWREMGIPLWLSFAFWQWLALGMLWIGLAVPALACSGRAASPRTP